MTGPRFTDKYALVTGGASGIGAAVVARLTAEGARVAIADINADLGMQLAESTEGAIFVSMDVTKPESVEAAFAQALEGFGRLDILCNNAGLNQSPQDTHETELSNWDLVSSINGDGAFYVLREGLRALLRSGGGSIVNTASVAGLKGIPQMAPYTYAKTGLVGLTSAAALEYAGRNIRVNAVAPGNTMTPLLQRYIDENPDPEQFLAFIAASQPLQGQIQPDDIADAILFLASDQASMITGHTIPIDGGFRL
jgi:NAD(P)-dependent dehydrogenase (short-subunit alcohol dehydrogenase family)